jgi:hypothetical protein
MSKELELEQDDSFQKKMWKFQQIGIIALLFLLLVSLAGFFGSGPLSFKEDKNQFIEIKYPYLARFSHPETIKISLLVYKQDTIKIVINRNYLEKITIERIIPQPVEESLYKEFIEYSFLFSDTGEKEIRFDLQFRKGGIIRGEWGIKDKTLLHVNHFIFP